MGAVQQLARLASKGYSAASIDVAMSWGLFLLRREDEDIDRTDVRMIIDEAMAQLDDFERELIWLRFYEQHSQSEIAQIIGTSQMQVSRSLSRLPAKMQVIIGVPDTLPAAAECDWMRLPSTHRLCQCRHLPAIRRGREPA